MTRARILAASFLSIFFLSVAFPAMSQEAILSFALPTETVVLPPGATTSIQLVVSNNSVYEAEELEFAVTPGVEDLTVALPPSLEVLNPYNEQVFDLSISAATDLLPGIYLLTVEAVYSYCIDVSCFQITEELEFEVDVEDDATVEIVEAARSAIAIWTWLIPILLVLAVIGTVFLSRVINTTLPLHLALFLAILGGLVYGVLRDQHEQARAIGSVLCTSCVGLEETQHATTPVLSSSARTALDSLQHDIELLVFHSPWCHSCPYAEAMVATMGTFTNSLAHQLIDVEQHPDLAIRYGVIRSGRTVVPAIVRRDTGEVIFGVEDLEARLLSLLGVGP